MSSDPTEIEIQFDPTRQRARGITYHGDMEFDVPFISQIDGDLWQGGCEDGLILPKFIKHLVSLYPWQRYTIRHDLSSELYVSMYDSEDQAFHQVDSIATWVAACVEDAPTLVHCQAGLNRSSLVTARVLMLRGYAADDAIEEVRAQRSPACLCNPSFDQWLREQA